MSKGTQDLENQVEFSVRQRSDELERKVLNENYRLTDRLFVWLMIVQWVGAIAAACWVAPYTWIGQESLVNFHVWLAIVLGGALSSAPILLGIFFPGRAITRHVIAFSQALWGAFLIHLSGGRVETHFHVFCSLAFIAFYRDWKVLVTMTLVVAVDHAVRGLFFPLSVYGVVLESPFRWIEHAAWVIAEDVVLVLACLRSRREARAVCENQAELEYAQKEVEGLVEAQTRELGKKTAEAEQFALVAKHTSNSVLILNANGHIESVNEAFTRITGYTLEEVVGRKPIDVLGGPTTMPEERKKLLEGLASQEPFDLIAHKHRKNGEPMVLAIEARPIFDCDGNLIRYFQIESDITQSVREHEQLEQLTKELQESTRELEKLSLVAKYTDNAVVITDAQSRIEWVNEGFSRMTGYTLDEVEGRVPGHFLQGPATNSDTVDKIRQAVRGKNGCNVELVNYHRDGKPYWSEIEIRPIRNDEGEVKNFIAIKKNITARKNAEQDRDRLTYELQSAARQAGMAELASDVIHTVGNALNSINVSAQVLRQRIESKSVTHLSKAADLITRQGSKLTEFLAHDNRGQQFPTFLRELSLALSSERKLQLDELCSLSEKIEHVKEVVASQSAFSHCRVPCEPVSPIELLETAIRMSENTGQQQGIEIVCVNDEVPDLLLEKHTVLQILIHLIKNAKESVQESHVEKPEIRVSAMRKNDEVSFVVTDNGGGIHENNLVEIFQQGYSTKADGRGYGLHSSANVAQELGGVLMAESEGMGKGATFTLCLPMREVVCSSH